MEAPCKYCKDPEDKQNKPGVTCENCTSLVHLTCLRRSGTPGDFECDVFFKFTCEDCSPDKREEFVRYKFPWVNVIYLTLHHLSIQSYGISHRGYFHYKTHICSFIDRYWQTLFGTSNKQKKNWVGTIAGVLSVYNKIFFKSGSMALGETGWWRLLHNFSPAVAAHIIQEMAKDKPRNRQRNQPALDRNHFIAKISEMGYKFFLNADVEEKYQEPDVTPCKKRRMNSEDSAGSSFYMMDDSARSEYLGEMSYEEPLLPAELQYQEMGHMEELKTFDFAPTNRVTHNIQSDTSSMNSFQHHYYESDSHSNSDHDKKPIIEAKIKKQIDEKPFVKRESLFSTELNSKGLPWEEKTEPKPKEKLVELTQYEEIQLLKQIENLIPKVRDPNKKAYLYRFKAKLALRRLKRHKHLPLFDVDNIVKLLGGYVTEDPRKVIVNERVLDRFQRSECEDLGSILNKDILITIAFCDNILFSQYLMDNLCGTISPSTSGALTLSRVEPTPSRSAYSGALLKPYIRRDSETTPTWLKLTDELLRRTHRHIKDYSPPAHATLDYSYVRPQHIASVNSLCAQFFWPGIDLTEALQYPEFSCVVTYKRLVVGCAFLVPDSGHNQAYISFVLTRPEWRRAGIATFMLYHLLQTCTGKDVTLHVSPTNPAIFLYQKFGFKVEELVQDFYEKYYDIEYKGCRHALFLRLVR